MRATKKLIDTLLIYTTRVQKGEELSGTELGEVLSAITKCEVAEGGPYGAVSPGGVLIPDLGLSLVIERFLHALSVSLPNLTAFIHDSLAENASSAFLAKKSLAGLIEEYRTRKPAPPSEETLSGSDYYEAGEARMMQQIVDAAMRRFESLPLEMNESARRVMARTIKGNKDKQMSLMAYYVREALGEGGKEFSDEYIAELGLANIFFWSAFIVYDDFWDVDEAADPRLLPVANLFARHYTDYFSTLLPDDTGFRRFFHESMDKLDAANEWETSKCRMRIESSILYVPADLPEYGDYGIKYHPAAGHVLGPVALLVAKRYSIASPEVSALIAYFQHYLIAMQLNDDAHDWKEDLARGHISTAVHELLRIWKQKHPERNTIHLHSDMAELEQLFWFRALTPLCESVLARAEASRNALRSLTLFTDTTELERFITRNERVANEALAERAKTDNFLAIFA